MAEFSEVMKHAKRMCAKQNNNCEGCPIYDDGIACPVEGPPENWKLHRFAVYERIIMSWAAANPELKYPTWVEWWNENFSSEGRRMLTPCSFVPPAELGCSIGMDGCMNAPYKCWHTPIPADIAEKLNIKPIGG
jgi:hypothetical protein